MIFHLGVLFTVAVGVNTLLGPYWVMVVVMEDVSWRGEKIIKIWTWWKKKVIKMSHRSFSADSSDSVSGIKHFLYETHKNVRSY